MQELEKDKNLSAIIISKPEEKYQFHQLARPLRVIFVRLFDIILASLIPLALNLTTKYWDQVQKIWVFIFVISVTFIIFFSYFIIIPYFWDGKTIGKFFFQIKLVRVEAKLNLAVIFIRELFITFLPWFVVLLTNLILNLIFKVSLIDFFWKTNKKTIELIVIRTITTIYFLWYLGLIFGLVLNKNHQILFDCYFNLFNVNKNPIPKKTSAVPKELITTKIKHIHLQENQPGNISDEILKEIDEL